MIKRKDFYEGKQWEALMKYFIIVLDDFRFYRTCDTLALAAKRAALKNEQVDRCPECHFWAFTCYNVRAANSTIKYYMQFRSFET